MRIFLDLFDEPEKAITSKEKAKDNGEDEMLKLFDEAVENIETHEDTYNPSRIISSSDYVEGEDLENFDSHTSE